ncbi:C2 domain-containing protein, partial [Baffinella frigidus]
MTEKISECDVYIKVTVTDKWKKTKVVRNTISPEWSEYYVFPVGSTMTTADVLLFNWQRYGPHTLLGQVSIPVGQLDADDNNEGTDKWYELLDGEGRMMEGAVRVRTQWRRTDGEEWTPIPE